MAQTETKVSLKPGGIFKQIGSWFANRFRSGYKFFASLVNPAVIVTIDQDKAITEGFNGNTAVYSIVMKDANKFASIPRYLYDKKKYNKGGKLKLWRKASKDAVIVNKLSERLERPNKQQGQAAFFKQVRAYYKTCGEAFIELNRGDVTGLTDKQIELMEVIEMHVLPTNKIEVIPDPEDMWGVLHYTLDVGGEKIKISKVNIIHWKDVNLNWDARTREHLRGMPALKPGEETLQANQDAELGTVRMIQNDGAKGILTGEDAVGSFSPEQESQVRSLVDAKVNNSGRKGQVATIMGVGKTNYHDLGGTSIDMQLLESKNQSWQDLCALLDVPYLLFDPKATYANLKEAKKNWVNDSIIPASKELDDELNRVLLRAFQLEDKAIIACDYTELPELQEDMKMLTEWMNASPEISPNERRVAKGFESNLDEIMDEPWMDSSKYTPLSQIKEPIDDLKDNLLNDYKKPVNAGANRTNGVATVPKN